ncbi:hypothetical protein INT45_013165 [Circinella minor]|uniref:PH domain-containing protein n=1 Tax=Circinella minor TaxID=1195481 RepID=A0A8H7VCW1_9FUNG|nr:hypothetical protein INT45_013165 [Circinella minor]
MHHPEQEHQRPNQYHQERTLTQVNKPDGAISSNEIASMTLTPAPSYSRMAATFSGTLSVTSSASSASSASAESIILQHQQHAHYHHASPIKSSTSSQYSPSLSAFQQKPDYSTAINSTSDIFSVASDPSDIMSQIDVRVHRSNSLPEKGPSSIHNHYQEHGTEPRRQRQYSQLLHAGDLVLHEKPDSIYYKSVAKARSAGIEIPSDMVKSAASSAASTKTTRTSIEEYNQPSPESPNIITTTGINTGTVESYTFRIEYTTDEDETKRATAVVAQVSTENELRQWILALRQATRVISQDDAIVQQHHHLSPSERYATVERIQKHNDVQKDMVMFKVVYKEKRRQSTNDLVPKDIFTTVILVIGKYSFYILPSASSAGALANAVRESTNSNRNKNGGKTLSNRKAAAAIIASASLANLERDRFGLLAISHIELREDRNGDDTFRILVRQIGKPELLITLASSLCEDIIQKLRQAIDSLAPIRTTYTLNLPDHLMNSAIVALSCNSSYYHQADVAKVANNNDPEYDEQFLQFELLLHAHCAALNLNKARFFYDVSGPLNAKRMLLLPPNAINHSADTYSKYEILALFRCLWHNVHLDIWSSTEHDGWAIHPRDIKNKGSNSVLANELYALLVDIPSLTSIDLTDCHIGSSNNSMLSPPSSLASIGIALQQTNNSDNKKGSNCSSGGRLDKLCIGKNQMSTVDIQELINGLHARKGLKHLDIHDMNLHARQIEQILSTLLTYNPEKLTYLDISYSANMPGVSPGLVETILERCTQLQVLRLKGHRGLQFSQLIFKCQSTLTELDMSLMKHTDNDILQLTQWIQSWTRGSEIAGRSGSQISNDSNKVAGNNRHSRFIEMPMSPASLSLSTASSTVSASISTIKQHVLRLDDCGLHGGHLRDIMQAIYPSGKVHVSFNGNPVLKDVVYLPKLFPVFTHGIQGPTSLALGRIEWEENSLRELFDCLRDNQTLTYLDLAQSGFVLGTGKQVSHDMVRVLTRLFERNTVLKELTFRSSTPLLGKAISQALIGLKHNRHLERLDLTGLELGDAGAQALADVLEHNRTLQALQIDQNMTTINGFRALTASIPKSTLIELSRPYKDLRYQLQTLRDTIAGLIQSENEMQWFIIHSTQASETRRTRSQLQMQNQTRRSAESNYTKITGVVNKMMQAIEENSKRHEAEQQNIRTMQLKAEYAAEELAIAQLRLQSTPSSPSSALASSASSSSRHTYYTAADKYSTSFISRPRSQHNSTVNYHITQSPLPSPPPPWNISPSSSSSTQQQQQSQKEKQYRDSQATIASAMTPVKFQYDHTYPDTPISIRRASTPEEYIGPYEEEFVHMAPSAISCTSADACTTVPASSQHPPVPPPPRRNVPSNSSIPPRRPPRRRHVTEPTIDENFDHPGFIDDFGIIVRQELGSIVRNQHQQRF